MRFLIDTNQLNHDVYVILIYCIIVAEDAGPLSYIGPNETTASTYNNLDDTLNSIFIPNGDIAIERSGNLTQWTVAFLTETVDIYLQVCIYFHFIFGRCQVICLYL